MSSTQEFRIPAQDDVELVCWRWEPAGTPTAVVVIVHGMGEHAQRYGDLATALTAEGCVVYAYDQRGYGKTRATGQEPGAIGAAGWAGLIADIDVVRAHAADEHPRLPVVLLGHSMGSFEVQEYLVDHSDQLHAAVLSGTAAADLLFAGTDFDAPLDLSAFNAPFEPRRTDADWLSRDEAQVDAYVADPACGASLDAEALKALYRGAVRAADPAAVARIRPDLPVYLTVGEADPVNAGMTLVTALVQRLTGAGVTDVTVRSYPGARHEVFNETNRDEVVRDLTAWLSQVLARPA